MSSYAVSFRGLQLEPATALIDKIRVIRQSAGLGIKDISPLLALLLPKKSMKKKHFLFWLSRKLVTYSFLRFTWCVWRLMTDVKVNCLFIIFLSFYLTTLRLEIKYFVNFFCFWKCLLFDRAIALIPQKQYWSQCFVLASRIALGNAYITIGWWHIIISCIITDCQWSILCMMWPVLWNKWTS